MRVLSDACGPVGHPNLVSPEPDRREPESGFIIIEWEKVEGGVEDRAMIRRPRIVHKATFEERLAEEARQFKEAAEKQPPAVRPASCFCAARDKPKQPHA